jgi:SAM-dependent methyltransferase
MNDARFEKTIERFTGFAALYDAHRPSPPAELAPYLSRLASVPFPELVVDIGSGTGLSTRYWAERARRVIGVEPTAAMRAEAEARTARTNVTFRAGFSHDTRLPDHCADIVVCVQALHWMDPAGTFTEAARLLRTGGVFAACDYDWPPSTGVWEADAAYVSCIEHCIELERMHGLDKGLIRWDKPGHAGRMVASGKFRFVRETLMHMIEDGDADRLYGLLLSQGATTELLKKGVARDELGLGAFEATVKRVLGTTRRPWVWSARVCVGVI